MYNPRSVVLALTNNNIGNYWTSSGPYDEIFYYIKTKRRLMYKTDSRINDIGRGSNSKDSGNTAAVSMNLIDKK